jgi:hypothetical protein
MLRASSSSTHVTDRGNIHISQSPNPPLKQDSEPDKIDESGPSETQSVPNVRDPSVRASLFNATISLIADVDVSTGKRRMGVWFPVRGIFDTGSNCDFVSEDVIRRAGLESFVRATEDAVELEMFSVPHQFQEQITLNFQLNNEEKSYTREFWVAPNARNFDLIVGEPFMMKHGYGILESNQSRKKTFFFGNLKVKLGWRSRGLSLMLSLGDPQANESSKSKDGEGRCQGCQNARNKNWRDGAKHSFRLKFYLRLQLNHNPNLKPNLKHKFKLRREILATSLLPSLQNVSSA